MRSSHCTVAAERYRRHLQQRHRELAKAVHRFSMVVASGGYTAKEFAESRRRIVEAYPTAQELAERIRVVAAAMQKLRH